MPRCWVLVKEGDLLSPLKTREVFMCLSLVVSQARPMNGSLSLGICSEPDSLLSPWPHVIISAISPFHSPNTEAQRGRAEVLKL